MKKDEFVADCSDIDDIIVFTQDGKNDGVKNTKQSLFLAKISCTLTYGKKEIHEPFTTRFIKMEKKVKLWCKTVLCQPKHGTKNIM